VACQEVDDKPLIINGRTNVEAVAVDCLPEVAEE
jgi:hypothetical protein